MDPYQELANAVVMQAVKDWRSAVRALRKDPNDSEAAEMMEDCESFFCSSWFTALTDADGSYILQKLKEENSHDK